MVANLDERTFSEYTAFLSQDDKVTASILSSARVALDLWSDPDIILFSSSNSVDIEALRNEKSIIYVIVPEDKIKYFSIIVNLFYSACFNYCLKHSEGNSVFYFLDEFGNLGKIPNFATIATTMRKRKCSISIILQEMSQLTAVYGKDEAKALYAGGMSNKLFFSGLDLETCQYLEKMLGVYTEYDRVSGSDEYINTVSKPLMRADEIRMLPKNRAIFISGDKKPALLKMKPYFQDRKMRRWVEKKYDDLIIHL